jgi:hypothetical protein
MGMDNIDVGTLAQRPAPRTPTEGKFYLARDTDQLVIQEDMVWTEISLGGGGGGIDTSTEIAQIILLSNLSGLATGDEITGPGKSWTTVLNGVDYATVNADDRLEIALDGRYKLGVNIALASFSSNPAAGPFPTVGIDVAASISGNLANVRRTDNHPSSGYEVLGPVSGSLVFDFVAGDIITVDAFLTQVGSQSVRVKTGSAILLEYLGA